MTTAVAGSGRARAYCGARKRQTEGTCQRPAGWGTDHPGDGPCKLHGGSTAAHRRRAALRAVEADASAILASEGRADVRDPIAELAELTVEAKAFMRAAGARVNALGEVIRFTDDKGSEQLRAEVALFERAIDRVGRFLEVLARLGYSDRLVQLAERQVDTLDAVLRLALERAGLAPEVRARVIDAVPAALGELVAGGGPQ